MKLSILDQSPVISGKTPREALLASVELAKHGEDLGFIRYWIAEHHNMSSLASSVPEVMLGYIGANTDKIRIGSGAVLLPHYKPYKVAETYNMLQTLFPDRIDLGIGRAPGGSAEASIALSGNYLDNVKKNPESISELLNFIYNDFPPNHFYSNTTASPLPVNPPDIWMLGTSIKSARLAAENGTGYAFGHFMSDKDGPEIVQAYKENFKQKRNMSEPYTIVTVSVICADTYKKAQDILFQTTERLLVRQNEEDAYSSKPNLNEEIAKRSKLLVLGDPKTVGQELLAIKERYQADEIMIVTITDNYRERLDSYQLVASELIQLR
ncbi:MsnO8 family LLM class oxidoreductase [Aquibacillus halophilus]|uniref:MsnO8 family LLM class oxidoreductase n=1 Tax=Aquibacillus halophilus TaxID=930132 RepID=A0A6A8DDG4_9BACI|nr:LLM class flavin-dependent oxidoreductase [Aquibacillus halophilus]MRH42566.1 MsnO8 family LLM class oxidoreductase [Aquibacillus halophilus]